jgi:hypothetical protein
MDLTSCTFYTSVGYINWPDRVYLGRTMEIFRMWGLVEAYRKIAIPSKHNFNEIFVTSFAPGGKRLSGWVRLQILCY